MKKKINFTQIKVIALDGNTQTFDISKNLGNAIYAETIDLGELELAREIYKNGEVEIDENQAALLSGYVRNSFKAFIYEVVCHQLDNLFKETNND